MKTVQTNEEILANAKDFLRYIEPTKFFLVGDPRSMTTQQLETAQNNAVLFNHWLLKNKTNAEGLTDYSLQSIKEAYIALRNAGMINFEVAPVIRKTESVYQETLNRKNHARDKSKDPVPEKPKTLAEEQRKAEMRVATNQGIEQLREEINTFRGKTHSDTYKGRAELTEVLNDLINGPTRRNLLGVMETQDKFKKIIDKYWS